MNDERARQALSHWLNARIGHWRELEHRLDASTGAPGAEAENARKLVVGFRALIGDLAMARKHLPNSPISRYLESLFIRAHEVVYRPPKRYRQRLQDLYCREIPMLMHDMQAALVFTLQVFLLSIAVGWLLVFHNPELVALFASSEMINHVESGRLWTDDMLNIMPSSILSFGIIANNATVSLFAFALGALYGLGTLYVIVLNGVMLGGIFA
ncbi:MAG: stage II sporulation protein M, partial [Gammaproteobacteria bacterium]